MKFATHILGLVLLLVLIGCSSEDEPVVIMEEEKPDPIDTTDMSGGGVDMPRTYSVETQRLGDLWINISTPSDYDENIKYPVLYYNDGDLYAGVFGLLTTLEAPPFIMVGISGDNDRGERFSPYEDPELGDITPQASVYSDAIIDDIIPFVEDKYSIDNTKKAIFGISLGGLHATWMAIEYPQVFSFVGALSPSYWVSNEALFGEDLSNLVQSEISIPTKIYFDRGTGEWRNHLSFVSRLKAAGLIYGKSLYYYEVIGGQHTTQFWQARIEIPFRLFLEGINASDEPIDLECRAYCAMDLTNNNFSTTRINPIIEYESGIKFSVISEAEYRIVSGSGRIAEDGTYTVTSDSPMEVEASYLDEKDRATLNKCN